MMLGRTHVTSQAMEVTKLSVKCGIRQRKRGSMSLLTFWCRAAFGPHPQLQSSSVYRSLTSGSTFVSILPRIQNALPRVALLALHTRNMHGIGCLKERIEIGRLFG